MTNDKISINSSRATSSILEGTWKANSAVQKKKFDELINDATRRTYKGDITVSNLNPHTSKNMISFFVKMDVPDNTGDKLLVPSASPLTDEGKAILAESQSQLSIRAAFSKVTHKLMNPLWDFKTTHFLKL